jgi:hypothetical protein
MEIIFDSLLNDLCRAVMLEIWKAKRATVWDVTGVEPGKTYRHIWRNVIASNFRVEE